MNRPKKLQDPTEAAMSAIEEALRLEQPQGETETPVAAEPRLPATSENDLKLETKGVNAYNDAVALCIKENDGGSRDLLESILVESEEHVDWLEAQLGIIKEIGAENYLARQLE